MKFHQSETPRLAPSLVRLILCCAVTAVLSFGCQQNTAWSQGGTSIQGRPSEAGGSNAVLASSNRVELGVNTNRHLCLLQREFLDRSHTIWVRGFLPATEFIGGNRKVKDDKPLAMLRAVADSGRKVILTIKWDLKKAGLRVPEAGSAEEQKWFAWVDELLDNMAGRTAILSVTNEMYADTLPADLEPGVGGTIPYVVFQQRLVAHVFARHPKAMDSTPLPIYVGGLHAMHLPERQRLPVTLAVLDWAAHAQEVAGVDLHLHVRDGPELQEGLRFTRSAIGSKPLIVTEFSPVWRYKEKLGEVLGIDQAGRDFAGRFGLNPDMRVLDYIDHALAQPVSEEQWQAFLASRSWFDPLFISKSVGSMGRYGVIVATYDVAAGLVAGEGRPLTMNSNPWLIHMLFVNTLATRAQDGKSPVNYGLFDDYLRMQEASTAACSAKSDCPWQRNQYHPVAAFATRGPRRCEF